MNSEFANYIKSAEHKVKLHRQFTIDNDIDEDFVVKIHNNILGYLKKLLDVDNSIMLSNNYIIQFQSDISTILGSLPYQDNVNIKDFNEAQKKYFKSAIEEAGSNLLTLLDRAYFTFDFFEKLHFFNNNIVAIGANGSGKTSLTNILTQYLGENGLVISAQRILSVPKLETLSNPSKTAVDLKSYQLLDKSNKNHDNMHFLQSEFGVVLKNLLAESAVAGNVFRLEAIQENKNGLKISPPPVTNLDRTLEIWNSLIEHRVLECLDGIDISVSTEDNSSYQANQMSDGEKVVLFLISQILQAPASGFIIVDEPEMYLHKTILKKLWDILEMERKDCLFLYLTHDLDFASSRITANKVWIRSFSYPNKWIIESVPQNELPENLMFELLGSRRNILFCEGQKGSIDEKIYNILFPQYTITPVENCTSVINYTKAFNKLPIAAINAFGIIDSDHHSHDRLTALHSENIFSFSLAESENLFLDEEFLKLLALQTLVNQDDVDKVKSDIFKQFEKDLDVQISNYISSKLNHYFKESHVAKGNDLDSIKTNYQHFTSDVNLNKWYDERKVELEKILSEKDYVSVLRVYNNKGLKTLIHKNFKISDFTERAIRLLQFQPKSQDLLKNYFPKELYS